MQYYVNVAVKGSACVTVEAENFEEAKKKAEDKLFEIDFGFLETIDWDAVNAEAEDGTYIDYK